MKRPWICLARQQPFPAAERFLEPSAEPFREPFRGPPGNGPETVPEWFPEWLSRPLSAEVVFAMSWYRKLDVRVWSDARFRGLSRILPSAQSLWLFLILGPHTTSIPGLFVAGEAGLAESLDWSLTDFRRCWAEIESEGMAKADWKSRIVWIPNAIRYNEPANINIVKGWKDLVDALPECRLREEACGSLAQHFLAKGYDSDVVADVFGDTVMDTIRQTVPETVPQTVPETRPKPSRKRTPNSETETETETGRENPPDPPCDKQGGKPGPPRPLTASDNPELWAAAKKVVKHYQAVVRPAHLDGGGPEAVMALLDAGYAAEQLIRCADGYAEFCRQTRREGITCRSVAKFYAPSGEYRSMLDWKPAAPPPKPAPPDLSGRISDEMRARLRAGLPAGGVSQPAQATISRQDGPNLAHTNGER